MSKNEIGKRRKNKKNVLIKNDKMVFLHLDPRNGFRTPMFELLLSIFKCVCSTGLVGADNTSGGLSLLSRLPAILISFFLVFDF